MAVFDALLDLEITYSQIISGYRIEITSFTYPFLMTTGVLLVCVIFLAMEASGTEQEVVDLVIDSTNSLSFQ